VVRLMKGSGQLLMKTLWHWGPASRIHTYCYQDERGLQLRCTFNMFSEEGLNKAA
jgi:hypothetical protein